MSLLGAVAYLSHNRIDVVVFICAGQRYSQKPQIQHVRRLNKLLLWIQRNPKKLGCKRFQQPVCSSTGTHLRMISDAAYKKETDDGYSLRGALYCRGIGTIADSFSGQRSTVHIVDWACKSQRHVTRSTFSAELLAAGDAVDQGILVSHLLYEVEHGPMNAKQARDRRMEGGYIPTALYVDAKSVFAAFTATFIKVPAEKSLLSSHSTFASS